MQVTSQIKRLLLMNASSMIIFNYIGIFVNLYIWEKSRSIFDVTWFNLIMFLTWSLAFAVGSRLLSRFSTRLLIRSTAICGGITFLLLSFLELDNRLLWIACIGVPIGIMWGFYASAQNITLCVFGKGKDFEGYFSIASIIGQVVSIINPIAFAFIIKWIGYSGSFLLMFLFVTILMAVSFVTPPITLAEVKEPLFRRMRFQQVFSSSALKWMVPSCLSAGIFLQFQGLFALIFTFSVSEDKLVIALLNVLYATSTIVAMMLYRRLKTREGVWLTIGMLFISAGFLLPLLPKAPLLVASNILTTVGMFYFGTVWNTRQFRTISRHSAIEQARIFVWREWLLNIARITMLVLILFVEELKGAVFVGLIAFALINALVIPWFSRKGTEAFEQEQAQEQASKSELSEPLPNSLPG
ncbi:MFS transporter [Paenibacillus rigui]|uniref:MFS transporter n=1 Tax=Paenibacillus rigui TaxID=554312 RepID=A0A229UT86_9BACL|nr:MFS transporter [Paenibacillus rigui]OXM86648.1 MFS transporter [Paenibacillus rigui]